MPTTDSDMAHKHRFCISVLEQMRAYVPLRNATYGYGRYNTLERHGNIITGPNTVLLSSGREVCIRPVCEFPEDDFCIVHHDGDGPAIVAKSPTEVFSEAPKTARKTRSDKGKKRGSYSQRSSR